MESRVPKSPTYIVDVSMVKICDVRTTYSIFAQYMTKAPIELDAKLVRSVQDICSNLIHPRIINEITVCMFEHGEDKVEEVNLSNP
jgi:hypothetical protein